MDKKEAKMRLKVNINQLFLNGEILAIRDEYADKVNYAYVEDNDGFYRMVGLIR
ncbi:MAG: hypothetical protein LBD99_04185 [Candidatus Margulisbacteria bacterium]|jgi:hypothetical protein|nr:hypothetical protein [Candidatus Margulisiibacteriota bacterium]